MSDALIEISGLRKVYRSLTGSVAAVDGLDLVVPAGGIHGFLGPNGAGKTTTIRLLLGLTRPTQGSMKLLGASVPDQLPSVIDRVGALVDEPLFSPGVSGQRNLALLARSIGRPKSVVGRSLEMVRLGKEAKRSYRSMTAAQQQRLGIAAALLKDAELLILDEPTTSLDPGGREDFRQLLRDITDAGISVFMSSHSLGEVQELCHSVSIIGDGKTLAEGNVADLLGEQVSRTRVGVADPGSALELLAKAGHDVRRDGDMLVVQGHEHPEEITRLLAANGLYVTELSAIRPDLHSFYLDLTGHEPRPDPRTDEEQERAS